MTSHPSPPDLVPPPLFRQAVEGIAARLSLDAYPLLHGQPLRCNDMVFALQHYGSQDETGATIFIDLGAAEPGTEAVAFRALLERNTLMSAFKDGYFGVLPYSDQIVFCIRVALDGSDGDPDKILATVATMAHGLQTLQEHLNPPSRGGLSEHMAAESAPA